MYRLDDTIVAIASPAGSAPRGIVRASGPGVRTCLSSLGLSAHDFPAQRGARDVALYIEELGAPLDVRLCYWPGPRSYTGQDVAELHTWGSPPLLELLAAALARNGARLARPGEFTLRAFLAGRLDLTQAEAVLGVIDARHHDQLSRALAQLAGGVGHTVGALRSRVLDVLAEIEARLDFADEGIDPAENAVLERELEAISREIERLAAQASVRHRSDVRPRVVLTGPANAGKSSLFNRLLGRADALVADVPGTTRDYLEAAWRTGDLECTLVDTAGLDRSRAENQDDDSLSQRMQTATHGALADAALLIVCVAPDMYAKGEWAQAIGSLGARAVEQSLYVLTKADVAHPGTPPDGWLAVSSLSGEGLDVLASAVEMRLRDDIRGNSELLGETAQRCRANLIAAAVAVDEARRLLAAGHDEALAAGELRLAGAELALITGQVYDDEILDRIFSRFCIGK